MKLDLLAKAKVLTDSSKTIIDTARQAAHLPLDLISTSQSTPKFLRKTAELLASPVTNLSKGVKSTQHRFKKSITAERQDKSALKMQKKLIDFGETDVMNALALNFTKEGERPLTYSRLMPFERAMVDELIQRIKDGDNSHVIRGRKLVPETREIRINDFKRFLKSILPR
jgi:hypothetical protein